MNVLKLVGLIFMMSLLAACGEGTQLRELKAHVAELKQQVSTVKKEEITSRYQLPEVARYGAVAPEKQSVQLEHQGVVPAIQTYALKSLKFVGIVAQDKMIWGIIEAPDGKLFQVKEGDIIGDNYGKIVKVTTGHIEVSEGASENGKMVMLRLKE